MKLKLQYKRSLFIFLMIAMIAVSIKPLVFTYHYLLANNYLIVEENQIEADFYILESIRIIPKINTKFKMKDGLVKAAILFQKKEIFYQLNKLERIKLRNKYDNNFYFQSLFGGLKKKKNWKNLDQLSYYFLKSPWANNMSKSIIDKINSGFNELFFEFILDFLKWQKNEELFKYISDKYHILDYKNTEPEFYIGNNSSIDKLKKVVGEQFNINQDNIGLNLLDWSMSEEQKSFKEHWLYYNWSNRVPFGEGGFYLDKTSVNHNPMIRIFNPYIKNTKGKSAARAGIWHKSEINLEKSCYIFSFDYWTKTGREDLRFWLGQGTDVIRLIDTKKKWQKVVYIFDNTKGRVKSLRPLIRMYGTGSLWFDNVFLGKLEINNQNVGNGYIKELKIDEIDMLRDIVFSKKKEWLKQFNGKKIAELKFRYKDNFYFQNMFDNLKEEKNWEHLDMLSYFFLSHPLYNKFTKEILEKGGIRFSKPFLTNLLDFLKWQKNEGLFKYISKKYNFSNYTEIKPKSCVNSEFSINRLKKIVTEKLKVHKDSISSNMLYYGDFDRENSDPKDWIFYYWSEPPLFGQSSFFVEKEKVNNNNMIRSFNPYINNSKGKSIARAGLWYKRWVKIKKGYYMFSFDYWTKTGREDLRFWLGKGTNVIRLIDTKTRWQKVVYILDNTKGVVKSLRPLIRMYGTGSLWFDNVFLGKLAVKELSQEDKNLCRHYFIY